MWRRKKAVTPPAAQPKVNNSQAIQPREPAPPKSRLGASLVVKGEISGNEDLTIDGSVEGLIQLDESKLTIGATAKVTADIIAREVLVYGSLKGNLRANKIEIKKDASVTADLTMAQILIEDGAHFKGAIEIEKSVGKESNKDALPPAA